MSRARAVAVVSLALGVLGGGCSDDSDPLPADAPYRFEAPPARGVAAGDPDTFPRDLVNDCVAGTPTMTEASVVVDIPPRMVIGDVYAIQVALSSDLSDQVAELLVDATDPEQTIAEISGCTIKATIAAFDSDFELLDESATSVGEVQAGKPVKFAWDVRPVRVTSQAPISIELNSRASDDEGAYQSAPVLLVNRFVRIELVEGVLLDFLGQALADTTAEIWLSTAELERGETATASVTVSLDSRLRQMLDALAPSHDLLVTTSLSFDGTFVAGNGPSREESLFDLTTGRSVYTRDLSRTDFRAVREVESVRVDGFASVELIDVRTGEVVLSVQRSASRTVEVHRSFSQQIGDLGWEVIAFVGFGGILTVGGFAGRAWRKRRAAAFDAAQKDESAHGYL